MRSTPPPSGHPALATKLFNNLCPTSLKAGLTWQLCVAAQTAGAWSEYLNTVHGSASAAQMLAEAAAAEAAAAEALARKQAGMEVEVGGSGMWEG